MGSRALAVLSSLRSRLLGWSDSSIVVGLWIAMFLVRLAFIQRGQLPFLVSDEVGVLVTARYLAGEGVGAFVSPVVPVHPGYPLLLAPIAALTGGIDDFALGAQLLNAALVAVVGPAAYMTLRVGFGSRRGVALPAAIAAGLYPATLLQPLLLWTESLMLAVVAFALVAFCVAARRGSIAWTIVFAASALTAYAVHARGLILVIAMPLLVAASVRGGLFRRGLAGAVAAGAALAGAAAIRALTGWLGGRAYDEAGFVSDSQAQGPTALLADLANPTNLDLLALGWAGVGITFYVLVATLALVVPAIMALIVETRSDEPGRQAVGWGILIVSGAFIAATIVLFSQNTPARFDHLIYGRYLEPVVPLLVALGLVALARQRRRAIGVWAASSVVVVVAGLALDGRFRDSYEDSGLIPMNIISVVGLAPEQGTIGVGAVDLRVVGLACFVIVLATAVVAGSLSSPRTVWVVPTLVALVFVGVAFRADVHYFKPLGRFSDGINLSVASSVPPSSSPASTLVVDRANQIQVLEHNALAAHLPGRRVATLEQVDLEPGDDLLSVAMSARDVGSPVVVSGLEPLGRRAFFRVLDGAPPSDVPGSPFKGLDEVGNKAPAVQVAVQRPEGRVVTAERGSSLDVVVTNGGTAEWERLVPELVDREGGIVGFRVHVMLEPLDTDGPTLASSASLDDVLDPGDDALVSVPVPDGAEAGRYELTVAGEWWFGKELYPLAKESPRQLTVK